MKARTSIYLNPPLRAALDGANSISGRLGVVCDRYAEVCRRARIDQIFTEAELGRISASFPHGGFAAPIPGAIDSYLRDSGCADVVILAKIADLDYPAEIALIEYIERMPKCTQF